MKKENKTKQIAVWMDHSKAHFIDPAIDGGVIDTLESGQESQERFRGESGDGIKLGGFRSTNNEYHKHRREEEILNDYFEALEFKIRDFDHIYILGPGTARKEFFNRINGNKSFSGKTIESEVCDQMSENQLRARVRKHFSETVAGA